MQRGRWLRRKEAAAELGFSRQRLEKLIKDGRIEETDAGLIDIEKAFRQVEQSLDPVRRAAHQATAPARLRPVATAARRRRPSKIKRGAAVAPDDEGDGFALGSYAEARAEREKANAKTARLNYERLIGTMVSRAEVVAKEHAVASMVRDRILGFPSRLANFMPAEAMKMLTDECDRLIRELQDAAAKIAAPPAPPVDE